MPINTADGDDGLRRMYTRSIPATLRSISLLERSMCDAQQQWEAVVATLVEDPEGHSPPKLRAALNRVEKIANQTKAIKQELIPHLSSNLTDKKETFEEFCVSVMTQPSASPAPSASGEPSRVARLAARVWIWSLSFATVLNDLELLSGSLSFAAAHAEHIFATVSSATEANAFFLGEESTQSGAARHDEDVLRACELLYHLYTGDDDSAAESQAYSLLTSDDNSEEGGGEEKGEDDNGDKNTCDGMPVPDDFFAVISRVADWVATDNYAALGAFVLRSADSLPPLVRFFMQSMQEMVVHRRLVQMGLHNAWRPIIDISTELIGGESRGDKVLFAGSPRLRACAALQRESLPRRVAWPLPTPIVAGCFPNTR